jgi:hypothetical protein
LKRKNKVEVRLTDLERRKAQYCAEITQNNVAEWIRQRMRDDPNWEDG